jgi:hypothetical protein
MSDSKSPSQPFSELRSEELAEPFRRAHDLKHCELYWLPASIPAKELQRNWTLSFLTELVKRLAPSGELKTELFLEAEAVYPDRQEEFTQTALDFNPVMGFSRAPGAPLSSIPKTEHIEAMRRLEKPFDLKLYLKGVCYWFLFKQVPRQLELFWGFGGMTLLLTKPDPSTATIEIPSGVKKHPAFQSASQQFDIQGMFAAACSIQSSFLKKSKEYFGKGWEHRLEYRGLLYVLPRWSSRDFFNLPEEDVQHLFEVCDLFVTESPADNGVLLASLKPIRAIINEVVRGLRQAGSVFPEGL